MGTTIVRLSAEPTRTRLLMTQGPKDIGKMILPRAPSAHPWAAATLLEGLSLFLGERLSVVLCVDERSPSRELYEEQHQSLDFLARGENMLLRGQAGVGKSTLAKHLALAALAKGHSVRFTTLAAALADLLR